MKWRKTHTQRTRQTESPARPIFKPFFAAKSLENRRNPLNSAKSSPSLYIQIQFRSTVKSLKSLDFPGSTERDRDRLRRIVDLDNPPFYAAHIDLPYSDCRNRIMLPGQEL